MKFGKKKLSVKQFIETIWDRKKRWRFKTCGQTNYEQINLMTIQGQLNGIKFWLDVEKSLYGTIYEIKSLSQKKRVHFRVAREKSGRSSIKWIITAVSFINAAHVQLQIWSATREALQRNPELWVHRSTAMQRAETSGNLLARRRNPRGRKSLEPREHRRSFALEQRHATRSLSLITRK